MQEYMSEIEATNQVTNRRKKYLFLGYIVYLIGIVCFLITTVGLVMVYLKRSDYNNTVYQSHLTYLIRTFWSTLLYGFVSFFILFVGVSSRSHFGAISTILDFISLAGLSLILLTAIFYITRVVKGFVMFRREKPIAKPKTWFF